VQATVDIWDYNTLRREQLEDMTGWCFGKYRMVSVWIGRTLLVAVASTSAIVSSGNKGWCAKVLWGVD
jgi:hypothetical protein